VLVEGGLRLGEVAEGLGGQRAEDQFQFIPSVARDLRSRANRDPSSLCSSG
jgi:hypothetical protein